MQIPFLNPVTSTIVFIQSLLLYLRFAGAQGFEDAHWGLVMIPTFVAEFFLVAMLASEALMEGSNKKKRDATASEVSETNLSYILLEMVVSVLVLLTTALFVFFLDDETDLPLYWITTTFFGATILFFITTITMCKVTLDHVKCEGKGATTEPYETIHQRGIRTVFVGFLVMVQGLFLWLYNSPWGVVMNTSLFWILLPSMILLVISFIMTVRQTYFRRNNPGPNLLRQGKSHMINLTSLGAFILFILLLLVCLLLIVLQIDYGLVGNSKWIVLPVLIYSACLIPVTVYIYYVLKKPEECEPAIPSYAPASDFYFGNQKTAQVQKYGDFDAGSEMPQQGIIPTPYDFRTSK